MDISSATFSQEVLKIIGHVAESRFVAFDLEFSGVAGRRPGPGAGKLTLDEYYKDLRSAAQVYQILQVGLTIVTEDTENGRYVARPYNFNLSPLPATKEQVFRRVWSYNSGAIAFLMRNGFNVDRPLQQGVHYLSRQEEEQVRQTMIEDEKARGNIPDMKLKEEDAVVVEHIRHAIEEWQALPKDQQDSFLNVPTEHAQDAVPSEFNRYQVRLTHQIVRSEYPGLKTQGMGHFVQITNPTSEQQANDKELREQKREAEVANAVGFRWILEAIMGGDISKMPHHYVVAGFPADDGPNDVQEFLNELQGKLKGQSRALVGHNCLTDVINLYRCFIGDLPETVQEFSRKLHGLFPVILDTKFLASLGGRPWADTSLQTVEKDLMAVAIPQILLPTHYDRYLTSATYHEAGFDSWVTAKIGLKLPVKLKREVKDLRALVDQVLNLAVPSAKGKVSSAPKTPQNTVQSLPYRQDQKPGITKSLADTVMAPVQAVKSILGAQSAARADSTGSAVTETPRSREPANHDVKQLGSMSKRSNIFEMLDDDPDDAAEAEVVHQQRIVEMVEDGNLMPRWEEDAAFWRLVSNKLQANASVEGVLDVVKLGKQ